MNHEQEAGTTDLQEQQSYYEALLAEERAALQNALQHSASKEVCLVCACNGKYRFFREATLHDFSMAPARDVSGACM